MRFFEPSDSVDTTPMLLSLLDPVALPVNSGRNTRARVEEPPGEIMIVCTQQGFPRISRLPFDLPYLDVMLDHAQKTLGTSHAICEEMYWRF